MGHRVHNMESRRTMFYQMLNASSASSFVNKTSNRTPLITIVIPTYNEEIYIGECLESILNQRTRHSFEIIVVDGGSSDSTVEIVKSLQTNHNDIALLSNPHQYTPFALNIALKYAKGKFISRVDAHSYVPNNHLEKCIETFNSGKINHPKLAGVGGRWECANKDNLGKAIFYVTNSWFGGGISKYRYAKTPQLVRTVLAGFYPKTILKKEAFANEDFIKAQDAELNWRLIKTGYKLLYSPAIITYYFEVSSFKRLAKKMFTYGQARMQLIKEHPSSFTPSQGVSPMFVIYLLILPLIFHIHRLTLLPALIYLALNIFFSLRITLTKGLPQYAMITPLIFFVIHIFYGIGMLKELIFPTMKIIN